MAHIQIIAPIVLVLSLLMISPALGEETIQDYTVSSPEASAIGGVQSIKVERIDLPVTLSDAETYNVAGYLYYKGSYKNRILQILVHGGTYNHSYWDIPDVNGSSYSYARFMADRKYAVLAIDGLGTGDSDRPDGDFLTLNETAMSIHQVIDRMRSGNSSQGYAFDDVVLVGHSLGAISAIEAQADYGGADGGIVGGADALIVTALGHVPHQIPLSGNLISKMAANPYLTFPPDVRMYAFYYAPGADPAVIDYDNAHLVDNMTRGQLFTTLAAVFNDSSAQVNVPVLVQLAERDSLFPASFAGGEAGFWTNSPDVTVQSLPGLGHSFNGHIDRLAGWEMIDEWTRATLGKG